jgi:hypothetical protein
MHLSFSKAAQRILAVFVMTLAGIHFLAAQASSPSTPPSATNNNSPFIPSRRYPAEGCADRQVTDPSGRGGGDSNPDPLLPKRSISDYHHLPSNAALYPILLI